MARASLIPRLTDSGPRPDRLPTNKYPPILWGSTQTPDVTFSSRGSFKAPVRPSRDCVWQRGPCPGPPSIGRPQKSRLQCRHEFEPENSAYENSQPGTRHSHVKFENYDLDPSTYDEMFLPDGAPREHYRQVHKTLTQLSQEELVNIQDRVTRSFSNEGITFAVYGDEEAEERTIPVDCLPRVVSSSDWLHLEAGLTQRVKALNLFLEDVYGRARIVRDGVVPTDMVRGCPQYRIEMRGFSPAPWDMGSHLRNRPRAYQRRLHGVGGQPARPLRRVLHVG